ncbi:MULTISPECIES: HAD family phosphatase [unclassified Bartonella]|uniref:HAD family hydrolase n=1 Tax=unclassified Bartonella TaxID=2645622 RepID=UPI0023614B41|nr:MULTISPECIES: HAD-IB family hydrolase [unclassified Bartonella]
MSLAYAFFDVDGTLIRSKSMLAFHDFWYKSWLGFSTNAHQEEYADTTAILRAHHDNQSPRSVINRRFYEFFAGRAVAEVTRCAETWANRALINPTFLIQEVVTELKSHHSQKIEPVLVSGSFIEILAPIAEHLGVPYILATKLLHDGQKYNGRFVPPQTIGIGKALAIQDFIEKHGGDLKNCWAYGDDISDEHMLKLVGHPVAVIGDPLLEAYAHKHGWRCLNLPKESQTLAFSSKKVFPFSETSLHEISVL